MKNIITFLLILFSINIQAQIHEQPFPFSGSGVPRKYLGTNNEAILEIKYADNNSPYIKKPLIIVEDFDSGLMGQENPLGEVDCEKFLKSASFLTSGSANLPAQLNTYDIIYINFNNGHDYLQRNAYLVEDIIKWVNENKQNHDIKNVVLGQGMGGVIARYALRDMENQWDLANQDPASKWDHGTNLYISHDAPHQGINIPLSAQYLVRHIANQKVQSNKGDFGLFVTDSGLAVDIDDLRKLFERPAIRQLLINYVNSDFVVDNNKGNDFREELKNLGYPQKNIRNIAISNGSHCANTQPFAPSDTLFSLTASVKTTFLTDLLMAVVPIVRFSIGSIKPGDVKDLMGALTRKTEFTADFFGYAQPEVYGQVYHGSMKYRTKRFLAKPKWHDIITPRDYDAPPGALPYDSYPGGQKEIFTDPVSVSNTSSDSWKSLFAEAHAKLEIQKSYDYIATPSTLDVGRGQVTLTNSDYLAMYNTVTTPPDVIPFDNYTTSLSNSGTNENHISFNTKNGDWLAAELGGSHPDFDCTYICHIPISGENLICSGSESYSYPSWATSADWEIIQGKDLVSFIKPSSSPPKNATLTHVGENKGEVILRGTFTNQCGMGPGTRSIWVGGPPDFKLTPYNYGAGYSVTIEKPNGDIFDTYGGSTIEWSVVESHGGTMNGSGLYGDVSGTSYFGIPWTITIKVELKNGCPESTVQTLTLRDPNPPGPPGLDPPGLVTGRKVNNNDPDANNDPSNKYYSVYPNPSADIVNIESQSQTDKSIMGELFDVRGALVAKIPIYDSKTSFSVKGLTKGVYVLKIYDGSYTESHQIIVI